MYYDVITVNHGRSKFQVGSTTTQLFYKYWVKKRLSSSEIFNCQHRNMFLVPGQRLQLLQRLAELDADVRRNDAVMAEHLRNKERRRRRRWWVMPWLLRRPFFESLMRELRDEDLQLFRNFVRIDPLMFQELLTRIAPRIVKKGTWFRKALDPGLKLALGLKHFATGDSYKSLMYGFRVPHTTIRMFVQD